jgi:hypothetical protein
MASQTGARTRAVITYYRVKFSDAAQRIEAIRSDYLSAFESAEKDQGRTATSFAADGQNVAWAIGLSRDQRLDALSEALAYFEGGMKPRGIAQGRIF